jgi:cobalt-zinc-cadmium efflux system outer membrane protein
VRQQTAIVLGVMLGAVMAQEYASAQRPLSLADAQAEARAQAPESAELNARVGGAEAQAAQARRRFRTDPEISGSLFQGALIGRPDEHTWSIGASQLIDVSGSWKPRAASADADLDRARLDREDGLRALDERVAAAVADVALAQRLVAWNERITALAQLAADAARRQFDVGQASQFDADAAALDLAAVRSATEQTRGDLDRTKWRLAHLLGRQTATDLSVEDPPEAAELPIAPDFTALADRDPRVRAAEAEVRAARFENDMFQRLITPSPTFGVDYSHVRRDIPVGSFAGAAPGLTANWADSELLFRVGAPLPLFNRQRENRARTTTRMLAADARMRIARADVRAELESSWADLQTAARAHRALAPTSEVIMRDAQFVEQAVQAGAFDTTTRTQALRRLEDAERRLDTAVRDVRTTRAAWIRRALQ